MCEGQLIKVKRNPSFCVLTAALLAGAPCFSQEIKVVTEEQAVTSWQNSFDLNAYSNEVKSAGGITNTPLRDGSFYKAQYQTDLRRTYSEDRVDFFQFALTNTNDKAVLSSARTQIDNLQLGRGTEDYFVSMGDVAPDFSALSSSLAVRGILGQKAFENLAVTAFAGKVVDSWESAMNSVPRSQFVKEVYGAKVEKDFSERLGIYLTAQSGHDETGSITDPASVGTLNAASSRTYSAGFKYEAANWLKISGETAASDTSVETLPGRNGPATLLDVSWKKDSVGVRAGYHDLSPEFSSLSSKATAGITESVVNADWAPASWVGLAAGLSKTKKTTLALPSLPSVSSETDAQTAKANFSFLQNWGFSLQRNNSSTRELSSGNLTSNEQNSADVKYSAETWSAGLNQSYQKVASSSLTSLDSNSIISKLSVTKSLGKSGELESRSWTADLNFDLSTQSQDLLASAKKVSIINRSVSVTSQVSDWGNLNFGVTDGVTTRPDGQPDLKTLTKEVEASHEFSKTSKLRFYFHDSETNLSDPVLATEEKVLGAQYSQVF